MLEDYVPHNPKVPYVLFIHSCRDHSLPFQLDEVLAKMKVSVEASRDVMKKMKEMMDRGLAADPATAQGSSLKMLASFVCSLPDGTETGDHLALDLGGTNFRVLNIKLQPNRRAVQDSKIYVVPHELMVGTGQAVSCFRVRGLGASCRDCRIF